MKKVTKKLQKFINSIANVAPSTIPDDDGDIYYSKVDGSYLTRVGMENDLNYLLKLGITEQIQSRHTEEPTTACIGFNPVEQKWYGWSHRAIFGFTIDSKCKKGNCGYFSDTKENFMEWCLSFWVDSNYSVGDDKAVFIKDTGWNDGPMVDGVLVSYTYNNKVPNKALRGTVYTNFSQFPDQWGKGEWTAKTLEDAREMAVDFAKGVD